MSAFILYGMLWFFKGNENFFQYRLPYKSASNYLAVLFSMSFPLGVH